MKHFQACAVAITVAGLLSACGGGGGTPQEPGQRTPARPAITAGAYAAGELQASGETYSGTKLDQPLVTRIERDGSGEFDITYKINGVDRTVSFDADGYDQSLDLYTTAMGNWNYEVTFDPDVRSEKANVGKPLTAVTDFEHLDVYYTEVGEFDGPVSENSLLRSASVGYFVHGEAARTLPVGSASYSGRFLAKYYRPESKAPDTPSDGFLHSDSLSLTLDFADGSVSGTVERVRDFTEEPNNPVVPLAGRFVIDGAISGNPATGFEAELTGTEDLAAWQLEMQGLSFHKT